MALLNGLQQDAAAFLGADPFFTDQFASADQRKPITVLYEQLFDINARIAANIRKLGIVTQLLTVSGRDANPNMKRPYFRDIRIVARTFENVLLNRSKTGTYQPASHVAESIGQILHGWRPEGLSASLFLTDLLLVDDDKLFTWDAVFKIEAGMTNDRPSRLAIPAPVIPVSL